MLSEIQCGSAYAPGVVTSVPVGRPFLKSDLRERGWTDGMIRRWLGEPDSTHPRYGGGEYYLFEAERVLVAEAKTNWVVERDKWEERKLKWHSTTEKNRKIRRAKLAEERARQLAVEQAEERAMLAKIGILPALHTLNQSAKQLRDAARNAYASGDRALASRLAENKRHLYYLKGQALEWLRREGKLQLVGYHVFDAFRFNGKLIRGNFAEVLAGEGYRFHRPAPELDDAERNIIPLNEIPARKKLTTQQGQEAEKAVCGYLQGREEVYPFEWDDGGRDSGFEEDADSDEHHH